jgi:hypothetical protein
MRPETQRLRTTGGVDARGMKLNIATPASTAHKQKTWF